MTGCRFFHILGILSSYAEDPITGNGPALLKASFLVGRSELMFEPSTHTRSPSLYSMAYPCFSPTFLFITLFIFLRAFSTSLAASLILWTNSSTSGTLSVDFSPSPWTFGCLPRFTKNGDFPVLEYCLSLYANSAIIVLSITDVQLEVLFHFLINSLRLTTCLGVVGC